MTSKHHNNCVFVSVLLWIVGPCSERQTLEHLSSAMAMIVGPTLSLETHHLG